MGQIRTYQLDYLRKGKEQVNFKVFDKDGTYLETKDENILFTAPKHLIPLNKSLLKRYEKPLKEVIFNTSLATINYINQNSQFLYGTDEWVLGTGTTVQEANDFTIKPLSGNKYIRIIGSNTSELAIKSDISINTVRQSVPVEIAFSYYVNSSSTIKYRFDMYINIDTTGNGSYDYAYDFENNKWIAYNNNVRFQIINDVYNKWVGFSKTIEPFEFNTNDNDVNIEVGIYEPSGIADIGDQSFIDNLTIGEKIEYNFNKVKNVRTQFSYTGGFTAKYETDNIMSNELKDDNNFVGQIEGSYERERESVLKSLEALITQQILNDNRDYLTKYEGIFRNIDVRNVGLHNKIWIDFGDDVLQEPVSCYIDAMKYNVKNATIDVQMHTPNQDDDALSTYKSIAE